MVFIVENNGKIKQMQKTSYWLMKPTLVIHR